MRCVAFLLILAFPFSSASAKSIALDEEQFEHVVFDNIPETSYTFEDGVLTMSVQRSSSFLLLPFSSQKQVERLRFSWKSTGELNTRSAEHEREKEGDDSRLRIGLVLAGKAPRVPFFAPAWIKAIRDTMELPSDQLVYFTLGSKNEPGSVWNSPYSDSIELRAIQGEISSDPWTTVDHELSRPLKAVGLWIMADGDNTASTFTTELRALELL